MNGWPKEKPLFFLKLNTKISRICYLSCKKERQKKAVPSTGILLSEI